jgi:dynein heavy chain
MEQEWIKIAAENELLVSEDYSMIKTLGDPVEIRNWGMAGLPIDNVSVESGIIVQRSSRWPLIIDP